MTVLLAVLISGVLLDINDQPMSKYHLAFTSANSQFIKVTTDKDGKFSVDLAVGTYRFQVDSDGTYYPGLTTLNLKRRKRLQWTRRHLN
jgi:hypothetical protein